MCSWASLFQLHARDLLSLSCAPACTLSIPGVFPLAVCSMLMHNSLSVVGFWAPLSVACWATLSAARFWAPISVVCFSTPFSLVLFRSLYVEWMLLSYCATPLCLCAPQSLSLSRSPKNTYMLRTPKNPLSFVCSLVPQFVLCPPVLLSLLRSPQHTYMLLVYLYPLSFVCSWVPLSVVMLLSSFLCCMLLSVHAYLLHALHAPLYLVCPSVPLSIACSCAPFSVACS
jgi:hypothetical protein